MVIFTEVRYDDKYIYAKAHCDRTNMDYDVKIDRLTGKSNITREMDFEVAKACVDICFRLLTRGKLRRNETICWG